MKRQETVYFPRKARAPYFSASSLSHDGATDAVGGGLASPLLQFHPSGAAGAGGGGTFGSGATTNAHNHSNNPGGANPQSSNASSSSSTWNEADAAAGGGSAASRVASTNSLTRLHRVASETTAGRAAILPAPRRSDINLRAAATAAAAAEEVHRVAAAGAGTSATTSASSSATNVNAAQDRAESRSQSPSFTGHNHSSNTAPDWRLRVRMRTVGVGLVLALNIGTDPPDTVKPHPCAVLQCWMDPRTVSRSKAKEWIGERLEQQYAVWQLARTARPLRYRRALDPTVEDVRNLCIQMRRQARNE